MPPAARRGGRADDLGRVDGGVDLVEVDDVADDDGDVVGGAGRRASSTSRSAVAAGRLPAVTISAMVSPATKSVSPSEQMR